MAEKDNIKPKIMVDCVGLYCPIPIFNTTTEMEKIEPGEVLEMVTEIRLPSRIYHAGQKGRA